MPDYYNRFTREKGWKRLRFLADDRRLQSAELNEVQDLLLSEMGQLAQHVLRDGHVLRGLEIVVTEAGTLATITAGSVFFDRTFHAWPGGDVAIAGIGEETVGLRFTAQIVDHHEDPTLLNPASGALGFGLPGADRLTYDIALVANDPDALLLYRLLDGQPLPGGPGSDLDGLYRILARRTNDQSGSYLVRGMRGWVEARDAETFSLRVEAGVAYVLGWEIVLSADIRITVPRPLHYRTVFSEPKTFATGTDTYTLNSRPVRQINSVSATVEKTVDVNRGFTPGGSDLMPHTPIVSIESVSQGGSPFTATTDYVVDGDYISWAPGGAEPDTGTTYQVTLRYVKQMSQGADFVQDGDDVDFSPAGDNPVNGSTFNVNYDRYLGRIDILTLDKEGQFRVVQGQPEVFSLPPQGADEHLPVARIDYPPNGAAADCTARSSGLYRLTMTELARLRQRVQDLEYNVAITDLEQEAINVDLPSSKRAIFTDGLFDLSKMDIGHVDFSTAVHPGNMASPAFVFALLDYGDAAAGPMMLPYTVSMFDEQRFATDLINVNPYAASGRIGQITLTPSDDWQVDETTIVIASNETIPGSQFQFWEMLGREGIWANFHQEGARWANQWFGTIETEEVEDRVIEGFSRELTVAIAGEQFSPAADNLLLTFDGQSLPLTPAGATVAGAAPGSVLANAQGAFSATFTIPAGIPGGAKSVVVQNALNAAENQFAIGQVQRTITIRRRNITIDPVAQTFTLAEDTAIARVGLYFGTKDATLPLFVEIRNVVNGYPGPDVLAEKVVPAASVNASMLGGAETLVEFDRPAFCGANTEYCVVVGSESIEYQLWYAQLGNNDVTTGEAVVANPAAGVMFSSANGRTWTAHQAADLKFRLYRSAFDASATVVFDPQVVDGSVLSLLPSQALPAGTRVRWEYSADGTSWRAIEPARTVDAGLMLENLHVRVTLEGNGRMSPVIARPIGAVVVKWDAAGAYIGRNTDLTGYTDIALFADLDVPSGATVTAQYSIDAGATWTGFGAGTLLRPVTQTFSEYQWDASGITTPAGMMIRFNMGTSGDRLRVPRIRRIRAIAT